MLKWPAPGPPIPGTSGGIWHRRWPGAHVARYPPLSSKHLKWPQVGIWHRRWPGAQVACSTSPRPQYLRWAQVVIWHRRWPGAQVACPAPSPPSPAPQVGSGGYLAPQVARCSGGRPPPRHLRWPQVGNWHRRWPGA